MLIHSPNDVAEMDSTSGVYAYRTVPRTDTVHQPCGVLDA